jgi:hypothetical protein
MKQLWNNDDWVKNQMRDTFDETPQDHFAERLAMALRRTPQKENLLRKWKIWLISAGIIWFVLLTGIAYGIAQSGYLSQIKGLESFNSWWLIAGLVAVFLYFRSIVTFVLILLYNKLKNLSNENRTLTAG